MNMRLGLLTPSWTRAGAMMTAAMMNDAVTAATSPRISTANADSTTVRISTLGVVVGQPRAALDDDLGEVEAEPGLGGDRDDHPGGRTGGYRQHRTGALGQRFEQPRRGQPVLAVQERQPELITA